LKKEFTVYPNQQQLYYATPWYFKVTTNTTVVNTTLEQNATLPIINVEVLNFLGIAVSGRILNGIWIDFIVVSMMYIFLNNFNYWMVIKPIKIVDSHKTNDLLTKYRMLKNNLKMTNKQQKTALISEYKTDRLIKKVLETVYTDWNLLLIVFFILASIAGNSFIAFGYFIFGMVLIHLSRDYFRHA
jgi:hypothetical protein